MFERLKMALLSDFLGFSIDEIYILLYNIIVNS